MKKKIICMLIILDGFGYSKEKKYNAIYQAKKPFYDFIISHYPNIVLKASGENVGLPKGYIGNSEVGHLTIGTGKIVPQTVTIINKSIKNKTFFKNKVLINDLKKLKEKKSNLHLIGLLSNAGVHSNEEHLFAYLKVAKQYKIKNIFIHAILDGRDMPPKSAEKFLSKLDKFIKKNNNVFFGSIQGRFYAMDRDNNWDRTEKSYKILTEKQNIKFRDYKELLDYYYKKNITDEFIPPTQINSNSIINNDDGIIFFNFRPDRSRQLISTFVKKDFDKFQLKKIKLLFFITPVQFNKLSTDYLFKERLIRNNSLIDILCKKGYKTLSIAETEKYAHITYFFNGGREKKLKNEIRILIPSIKTKNYIDYPCMSALQITETILKYLKKNNEDFYLVNYANADMVGHSGDLTATIKSIECLDKQLEILYKEIVEKKDGIIFITADHGNAEIKYNDKTKESQTMHTINPVPFIFLKKELLNKNINLPLKKLSDIKSFILKNIK